MLEMVAKQMGAAMAAMEGTGFLFVMNGGQCVSCNHAPYRRRIWLYRHLRAKY